MSLGVISQVAIAMDSLTLGRSITNTQIADATIKSDVHPVK